MVIVIWIGLQIQCSIQIHFNKHSARHEYFKKYLQRVARAVTVERVKRERTLTLYYERYSFILVTCNMNAKNQTWNENTVYEQWQSPKKRARVSNLVKWDRWWWHKYTKLASSRSPM